MVFTLLATIYIINLIRKKKMDFKYGLGWLFIALCIFIMTIWPSLLLIISNLLGIASPMNMLFFLGFCFAIVVIFNLSISISHLSDMVKKLSQEIAIVRKDMYENYQKKEKIEEKEE